MGLVSIGDPEFYQLPMDDAVTFMNVIVGSSESELVKVFYTSSDSRDNLIQLLDNANVSTILRDALLKSMGFSLVNKPKSNSLSEMSKALPGVNLMVKHPKTGNIEKLWSIAIDLNDKYKWKREDIADWIENVAETKDITFSAPEVKNEVGTVSKFTKVVKIQRILSR